MRVFAGPNGSGKTTIINAVKNYRIKAIPVDFGIYVNADDIASDLRDDKFSFKKYRITTTPKKFVDSAITSGLINNQFTEKEFKAAFRIKGSIFRLLNKNADEQMAQILAHFLRESLIAAKKKFSFETVFSHASKLEIMKKAASEGYKVYLYYVSTESPEINTYRISVRTEKGGHDVPAEKIRSRYERSLEFIFDAAQIAYQAFFFDNSGEEPRLFAHFKQSRLGKKKWDKIKNTEVPEWFKKYYSEKAGKKNG